MAFGMQVMKAQMELLRSRPAGPRGLTWASQSLGPGIALQVRQFQRKLS